MNGAVRDPYEYLFDCSQTLILLQNTMHNEPQQNLILTTQNPNTPLSFSYDRMNQQQNIERTEKKPNQK